MKRQMLKTLAVNFCAKELHTLQSLQYFEHFFRDDSLFLTTGSPRDIIGIGGLCNFIDSKKSESGIGVWEWKLDESFWEWKEFLNYVQQYKESIEGNVKKYEDRVLTEKSKLKRLNEELEGDK